MGTHGMVLEDLSIAVPKSVLFQDLGDEVALLEAESGQYYGLNEVGARMWSLLQQGQPVSQVLSTLHEEYEVSEQRLCADLKQFLNHLQGKGLIEVYEKPPA